MNYTDFLELVEERYSCRKFSDKKVSNTDIEKVLEAARLAPSACNKQPWTFYVIESENGKHAICDCYDREWIKTAPAFIIAVGNNAMAWHRQEDGKDHTNVDLSIAIEHICLAATSLGLGTCWICNFDTAKLKTVLKLGNESEPVAIIPLGYPETDSIPAKNRKDLSEIIVWEKL